jgi:glutamine synthetase
MHVHFCGLKNGKNMVANVDGTLSSEGLQMIGGLLRFAWSLAAFGNPTPASYVRIAARKESPVHAFWSARNRMALIRIPLWWSFRKAGLKPESCKQTIEYRAPDAFANPSLLFAAMVVAAEHGLTNHKESLRFAEDLHVEGAFKEGGRELVLPRSCAEAAEGLEKDRQFFEADGVFPVSLVDETISRLKGYEDRDLWRKVVDNPEETEKLLEQYFNYG